MITHYVILISPQGSLSPSVQWVCPCLSDPKHREEGSDRVEVKLGFQDIMRQADIFPG